MQNVDADHAAFGIDVIDERTGFRSFDDLAATEIDLGGIGVRIISHVNHRSLLASHSIHPSPGLPTSREALGAIRPLPQGAR